MKEVILLSLFIAFAACQTSKTRVPNVEVNVSDEDLIEGVVRKNASFETKLSSDIRSQIVFFSFAQQLVSSFDLYLDRQQKHGAPEKWDKVLESDLSCKMTESFFITEKAHDRLHELQEKIISKQNTELYGWFIRFFESSKADSPTQILAKAQIVRKLKSNHSEICETAQCPEFPKLPGPPEAAFDPFNDLEMSKFTKKFIKKIAIYNEATLELMPAGNCIEAAARRKPSNEGYDWKVRNKVGRKLQTGEFIFTYDDGPHPKHTVAMTEAWTQSGLAKPAFFWLAKNVERFQDLARQVHAQNFEVAVHSYSHPDNGNLASATDVSKLNSVNKGHFADEIKNLTPETFQAWKEKTLDHQILASTEVIRKAVPNAQITRFRLPYGSGRGNAAIGERLQKLNMDHYFWDIDSLDWQDKNPITVAERVQKQMEVLKRGIILFHDIHPQSVEASKILIQTFKESKDLKVLRLDQAQL